MPEGSAGGGTRDSGRHEVKSIGGYELQARLGRGGMGAVYKARQVSMDRPVALKILPPSLARDANFVERFEREARAAGKLSHPNIVAGIDVGEADGYHYFAMEYVEGETLSATIKRDGRLAEKTALELAVQLARALAHAHTHGLVHRDVKPQNVLVMKDGTAKLCDLGLARSTQEDQSLTLSGTAVGTPHYIAPEQVEGRRDVDGRVDLYALGATLYHMLSGRPPFEAPTAAKVMAMHLHEPLPPLAEKAPGVSPALARIVTRLLEKDREKRYGSAADLADDLECVAHGRPPVHLSGGVPRVGTAVRVRPVTGRQAAVSRSAAGRPLWQRPPVLIGAGVAVVIAGVLAAVLSGGGPAPVQPTPTERVTEPPPVVIDQPPVEPAPADDAAEKELRDLFEYAKKWSEDNPAELDKSIQRFREIAEHAEKRNRPLWRMQARDEVTRLEKLREEALAAAFAEVETKVREAAGKRDYAAALAACAQLPAGKEEALRPRSERLAAEVRDEAEKLCAPALAGARAGLESGRPQEGLAALAALEGVKYAPRTKEAAELAEALRKAGESAEAAREAQRLAEAQKALAAKLDEFDAAVKACTDVKYAAALKLAREANANGALAPVAATVRSLVELAEALPEAGQARARAQEALVGREISFMDGGRPQKATVEKVLGDELQVRVEYRIPGGGTAYSSRKVPLSALSEAEARTIREAWQPAGEVQWLAEAAMTLAGGDAARAEAALEKAGEHPLAGRYREAVAKLKVGAAEFAAGKAWEELLKAVPEGRPDKPTVEKLKQMITGFETAHSVTAFARGKAAELTAIKERLAAAGEADRYLGEWTKHSPKIVGADGRPVDKLPERFGSCGGAIYDTRRKLCVLYGAGAYNWKRNYLWAYDTEKDTWTCLQDDAQEADGTTRPKPFFAGGNTSLAGCYDPARDLYWGFVEKNLWAYSPETRTWKRGPELPARGDGMGIAFWPEGKALAMASSLAPGATLDPESGKIASRAKQEALASMSGWRPASCYSGTFGQALGKGTFLVFGCERSELNNTFTLLFDPAKSEWQTLAPKQSPPGRFRGCLLFDEQLGIWVLCGGFVGSPTSEKDAPSDTWIYAPHLNTWQEIACRPSPAGMGPAWYDAARGVVVMLANGETWTLKLTPGVGGAGVGSTTPGPPVPKDTTGLDAAAVQRLFKGKVESFDPAKLEISLFYDFEDPAQGGDWDMSGDTGVKDGQLTRIAQDWARLQATHRAAFAGDLEISFDAPDALWGSDGGCRVRFLQEAADAKRAAVWATTKRDDAKQPGMALVHDPSMTSAVKSCPIEDHRPHSYRLVLRDKVSLFVDGAPLITDWAATRDGTDRFARVRNNQEVIFATSKIPNQQFGYDNVRIRGRLEKSWLENRLAGQ